MLPNFGQELFYIGFIGLGQTTIEQGVKRREVLVFKDVDGARYVLKALADELPQMGKFIL